MQLGMLLQLLEVMSSIAPTDFDTWYVDAAVTWIRVLFLLPFARNQ